MPNDTYDLRLELSRRYPAQGQDKRLGELRLTTTDPEQALADRNALRAALGTDYQIELYSVEDKRSRIFAVETYPRPKPTPAQDDRFLNLSVAIGALLKARDAVKVHIEAGTIPGRQECRDIARALAVFDLERQDIESAGRSDMMALSLDGLGFTYGVLIAACQGLAMTNARLDEVRADLMKPDLEIREPNKRLAEAHALQDAYALDGGFPISVRAVYGYKGDDNHTTDLVAPEDAPFKVVMTQPQSFDDVIRWQDDHLDPVYIVTPAPGETRLDGFRSLATDGRSYVLKSKA